MKRVLIAGGGITGLSTAYYLSKQPGMQVALVEGSGRLGGVIRTVERDGFLMEAGADSFLSEKTAALELALELNLEKELVATREEYRKTCVVRRGRLQEIPKGFYLIAPTDMGSFLGSPILSVWGKLRAMTEPLVPRRREAGDESLASFIRRRFGKELLERIGQPMVGGVYTGDPEILSLQSTFPKFADWEMRYGSVVRGLMRERGATRSARGPRYGLFLSFHRGMETLVRALSTRVSAESIYQAQIERLEKKPSGGWTAYLSSGALLEADAMCLAVGARETANLLSSIDGGLARLLSEIRTESVASVQLAFGPGAFKHEPRWAGFVVPAQEKRPIIAATFANLKFENRAPKDCYLVRVFVGGAFGRDAYEKSDQEMTASALSELGQFLGLCAKPLFTEVYRYPDAMVQYAVGHAERVSQIQAAASAHPGLYLAGNSYRGVGVPDCVAQAKNAARDVEKYLNMMEDGIQKTEYRIR